MVDLYITLPNNFDELFKKYKQELLGSQSSVNSKIKTNIEISYNEVTGRGHAVKEFSFKDNTSEFRVFKLLYENINNKITRYDILVTAHFYEEGEDIDKERKSQETFKINEIVKNIRTKTGLDTKQLVNNNGNLTLLGRKAENLPN